MKKISLLCLLLVASCRKQSQPVSGVPAPPSDLEAVLTQMDSASAAFKTAQADCEWDNHIRVVNETEKRNGQIYFRRDCSGTEVLLNLTWPRTVPKKLLFQLLFQSGKVSLYDPKIDQLIKQQMRGSSGDYWLQHCNGFQLNGKIPEDVFRIKTIRRTKVVKPTNAQEPLLWQ